MHIYNLDKWRHDHHFHVKNDHGERNTHRVIFLTLTMMVIEIGAGLFFGSMALLSDGWHMGTHAMALGITAFAYYYAKKNADNARFSFGTGKVGVLAGFTSAVVLGGVAFLMAVESVQRFIHPVTIYFNQAILVAVVGLAVNVFSAYLLKEHHHDHPQDSESSHTHHDHNLRAAYLHVLADALTSILAILALTTGKILGWVWMDPIMGIVGAVLISRWSYGLVKDTGKILLDSSAKPEMVLQIVKAVESKDDNRVCDIHVWPLGANHYSAILSIVTHHPKAPEYYKNLLLPFEQLDHITIEVHEGEGEACLG
jgi:cation diffusion facilitator family transporter